MDGEAIEIGVHRAESAGLVLPMTPGHPADFFPDAWRLITALEGLVGSVLAGWPAAFIATTMNRARHSS